MSAGDSDVVVISSTTLIGSLTLETRGSSGKERAGCTQTIKNGRTVRSPLLLSTTASNVPKPGSVNLQGTA